MKKIVVAHHSNQLGLGGTEKTMQLFCKYLDKDRFEVHALTWRFPVPLMRVWKDNLLSFLRNENARKRREQLRYAHCRVPEFERILGKENVHLHTLFSLPRVLKKVAPQILHVHHAGESEPPLNQPRAIAGIPVLFTTNVFGWEDRTPQRQKISKILFISSWLKDCQATWAKGDPRCDVLYYPIETPRTDQNLRGELGISGDLFVIGRVGRNADDIYDPISLKAYKEIESSRTLFLALSAPPRMKSDARVLGIRNILFLQPTVDEIFLSRFYNTMDVLAHARMDGETFGCVIAEAMIHGKPVITHRSHIRNAQVELVDEASGFVVDQNDWKNYAQCLKRLSDDQNLRLRIGESARKRAMENFEASLITRKLERFYLEELQKRKIL